MKKVKWMAILAILLCIMIAPFYLTKSEGERAGVITKLSRKGYVFKTWEGEMVQGSFQVMTSTVWNFSVADREAIEKVRKAMESGKRVNASYKQVILRNPFKGETDYFITDVKIIE
jgi:hypothetical protein